MFFILSFIGGLGIGELILIFSILIILFGAKKIPELARGLGKGIREFKDAAKDISKEVEDINKIKKD
jgi:sec-independent protein translocase protein TatA|tara:strand:- start:656 stop:856 length:201 start_codon:yes stop_codon:yes gene_type:complete